MFDPATVRVYGADSFCLALQQKLGFELCSPDDELLRRVPTKLLRRELARGTLAEAGELQFPKFIKPVVPKQFRGAVYSDAGALAKECQGLPANASVFQSEPVTLVAEARSFVLDGQVLDAAIYEGNGAAAEAATVVAQLAQAVPLPRAVVIDTGLIADRGWAIVEFQFHVGESAMHRRRGNAAECDLGPLVDGCRQTCIAVHARQAVRRSAAR